MSKMTDIRPQAVSLHFIPIKARIPIKFGHEIYTGSFCARVKMTVTDKSGRRALGWGETPLSIQWMWPGGPTYAEKEKAVLQLVQSIAAAWEQFDETGHPMEISHRFIADALPRLLHAANAGRKAEESIPWLAALVCCSAFDIALHDAFGVMHQIDTYKTYTADFMNRDLAYYLEPENSEISFHGKYPGDFLVSNPPRQLLAWHLVSGLDALEENDVTDDPQDGYPVTLTDWIRRDGLKCLKIKLRGNDAEWDFDRLVRVGNIAIRESVWWLSADFNCTVYDPAYVNEILDRLRDGHPHLYGMLLYIEQPFPYDLEHHQIDVHSVALRKPLFMDESAHDWKLIRLGRRLGWNGVALKTCKTQTGALLSCCWAKAHGMTLMVQDLANPMLAQIPHVRLAAHAGTIMGVESNGMQFFPQASLPEAAVHPGLFRRENGRLDLGSLGKSGLGYRVDEIPRELIDD
jgi:hypothetical protein